MELVVIVLRFSLLQFYFVIEEAQFCYIFRTVADLKTSIIVWRMQIGALDSVNVQELQLKHQALDAFNETVEVFDEQLKLHDRFKKKAAPQDLPKYIHLTCSVCLYIYNTMHRQRIKWHLLSAVFIFAKKTVKFFTLLSGGSCCALCVKSSFD